MTVIGLFRRYKRWNPVHPTYGAFWGLGIGAGCGVGWGPGFGPESVGFVGGGCGLGFSVGVTFVGFGIGLPSNGLTCLPYNVLSCATCEAFDFAKYAAPIAVGATKEGLRSISTFVFENEEFFLKGMRKIQSVNLMTIFSSIEAHVKDSWKSLDKGALEWEHKIGKLRCQALPPLKMVCKDTTGDSCCRRIQQERVESETTRKGANM